MKDFSPLRGRIYDNYEEPRDKESFFKYSLSGRIKIEREMVLKLPESRLEFLRMKSQYRAKSVISRYDSIANVLLSNLDKFEKMRRRFHLRSFYKGRENAVKYVSGYFCELGIIEKTNNLEFGEGLVGNLKGRYDLWSREKLLKNTEKDLEKVMQNEPVSIGYDIQLLGLKMLRIIDIDPHLNRTYRRELAFVRARQIISPNYKSAVHLIDELDIFEGDVRWIHTPGFKRRCHLAARNAMGYLESRGIIKTGEAKAAFGKGLAGFLRAKLDNWFETELEKNTDYNYELE